MHQYVDMQYQIEGAKEESLGHAKQMSSVSRGRQAQITSSDSEFFMQCAAILKARDAITSLIGGRTRWFLSAE